MQNIHPIYSSYSHKKMFRPVLNVISSNIDYILHEFESIFAQLQVGKIKTRAIKSRVTL